MTSSTTPPVAPVVVGFDASPWAELALAWAVDHARAGSLPVRVVVARGDLHSLSAFTDEWTMGLAREWADDAERFLAGLGPVPHEIVIVDGLPGEVLKEESTRASVLVVGSQGHHAVAGALLGSASTKLVREAGCPVVVVRRRSQPPGQHVVVGVDGSSSSLEALRFALSYAEAHGLELTVGQSPEHGSTQLPQGVAELASGPGIKVVEWHDRPAEELIRASEDAALLVVGARGHGAISGIVLGSVSTHVLRSAHCPVAVVR